MTERMAVTADPERGGGPGNSAVEAGTDSLARSTGRGALWQFVGAGWNSIVQLGASAVLARVLSPKDFGMLGMAVLAQGLIGRIGALGTGSGVIAKKDATEDDVSTAFWMGAIAQAFLFTMAFAAAPLVAVFFRTSALTWVMRAVSVTFLFTAVGSTSGILLRKRLQFGPLKIIESGGVLFASTLAIVLAVGFRLNYWALVLAMVVGRLATTVATVLYARWLPSLRFSRESFRFLFRYGIHGLGATSVGFFRHNIDYLLVGRLLGPATLGLYEFAYRIPHLMLNRLAMPVSRVLFPSLAKAQTSDRRLTGGYLKATKYIALIVFPLLGGLAVLARPTVAVLWGPKWLPVTFPLQLLCIAAAARCVAVGAQAVFLCKNRPDLPFKFGLAELAITFASVCGFGYAFGLWGVALGMVIGSVPGLCVACYALHLARRSSLRLLVALLPPTIGTAGCIVAAAGTYALCGAFHLPSWAVLTLAVPVGALAYISVLVVWFREQVREVLETVRLVLPRRFALRCRGRHRQGALAR